MSYLLQCQPSYASISVGTAMYTVNKSNNTITVPNDAGISLINSGNMGVSILSIIADFNKEQHSNIQ